MFLLDPEPSFKFRVALFRPGASVPQTLTLIAKHKSTDELTEWSKRAAPSDGDASFLLEVVTGWEGVFGADKKAVEFDPDAFRRLINNYPGAGLVIFKTYAEELNAGRLKN